MKLISDKYIQQNTILHSKGFGGSGWRWVDIVADIINDLGISSMLDYGCGQSTLHAQINNKYPYLFTKVEYKEYDPCIESKSICPGAAELVTCTDVLEHIEPKYIDNVIKHIMSLTKVLVFLNINVKEANKKLPDGRNAHLIIRKPMWWFNKLKEVFTEDTWVFKILPVDNPKNFNVVIIKREYR